MSSNQFKQQLNCGFLFSSCRCLENTSDRDIWVIIKKIHHTWELFDLSCMVTASIFGQKMWISTGS